MFQQEISRPEAPVYKNTVHLGILGGFDIHIRIADINRLRAVSLQLLQHLVDSVRSRLFQDVLPFAHGKIKHPVKILLAKLLHSIVRLIGNDSRLGSQRSAAAATVPESLHRAAWCPHSVPDSVP